MKGGGGVARIIWSDEGECLEYYGGAVCAMCFGFKLCNDSTDDYGGNA